MKYILPALCIVSTLLLVFRVHYYAPWINIFAVLGSLGSILFWLEPLLDYFSANRERPTLKRFIIVLLSIVVGLLWGTCVFTLHNFYLKFALGRSTEIVQAHIKEDLVRHSKSGYNRYLVYYYTFNNKLYNNEIREEETSHIVGDTFNLKISTFDPTVSEVMQ